MSKLKLNCYVLMKPKKRRGWGKGRLDKRNHNFLIKPLTADAENSKQHQNPGLTYGSLVTSNLSTASPKQILKSSPSVCHPSSSNYCASYSGKSNVIINREGYVTTKEWVINKHKKLSYDTT